MACSRNSQVYFKYCLSDEVDHSVKICTFYMLGLKSVISVEKFPEVSMFFGTPVKMRDYLIIYLTSEAKNTFG